MHCQTSCTSDFRTVLVDGVEISAKLKHKGKGIVVPNDDHLANVLTVLRARLTEGSNSDVEARASKRRALMMERKSANTVPRHVRYNTVDSGGRYTIFFTTFEASGCFRRRLSDCFRRRLSPIMTPCFRRRRYNTVDNLSLIHI